MEIIEEYESSRIWKGVDSKYFHKELCYYHFFFIYFLQ